MVNNVLNVSFIIMKPKVRFQEPVSQAVLGFRQYNRVLFSINKMFKQKQLNCIQVMDC